MGFWARFFRRPGRRPVIAPEDTVHADRLNDLVNWFLDHEEGVRRNQSMVLHALLLMGYTASPTPEPDAVLLHREGIESCGLSNQTTLYIWRRLAEIRGHDGGIRESDLTDLLRELDGHVRQTVLHLRSYDSTGTHLRSFLRRAEPFAAELLRQPDVMGTITVSRAKFEREVLTTGEAHHLAAIFIAKNFFEIIFHISCWFYYSWYGHQFYSPALPRLPQ